MRVETTIRLHRHFNAGGRPTEEECAYEVVVSAEVEGDEVGPVTVVDAPEMDGGLQRRVRTFHPLRGHEATAAQEEIWQAFLGQEKAAQEAAQRKAWLEKAHAAAVESVVAEVLEAAKRRQVNPRAVLEALAGALEGA